MKRVGLIGLGLMGNAIAARLLDHQFQLVGWDVDADRRADFQQLGDTRKLSNVAKPSDTKQPCDSQREDDKHAGREALHGCQMAQSADQVFAECETILLSLPNDGIVCEVLASVSHCLRPGQQIIDTSTGAPDATSALAQRLNQLGIAYLDATISGSSAQVRSGAAAILVGASEAMLTCCMPVLTALSQQVLHVGPPGSGSRMKLVTNLVLGLNRAALAEGLTFGESLGFPADRVLEVLRSTVAYSRIMDSKGAKMVKRDFVPEAKLDQHAKDVRLILASAERSDLSLPLSEAHLSLLERASQLGFGLADNSAVIEAYRSSKAKHEDDA